MLKQPTDVLVLGATGFTGRLITQYLCSHPQFASGDFTFAMAGRSIFKLIQLQKKLGIDSKRVPVVEIDVLDPKSIVAGIKTTRLLINVVGPYLRWGKPVIKACVEVGVHQVDLCGEQPYMKWLSEQIHGPARRKGVILISGCGQDSIPSDLSVYLSNQDIKAAAPNVTIERSVTAYKVQPLLSGGSIDTLFTIFNDVSMEERNASFADFSYSPIRGVRQPTPQLTYSLPFHPHIVGGFFNMQPTNKLVVQRTWGLQQARLAVGKDEDEARTLSYGPDFTYDEFSDQGGYLAGAFVTLVVVFGALVMQIPLIRAFLQYFMPKPGSGPSQSDMQKGTLLVTNVSTSSVDPVTNKRLSAKTVIRGRGDPAYLLTSVMIAESALAIALDKKSLPTLGQIGGVLTPASALGDVLVRRLERSGLFDFEHDIIDG